MVMSPASIRPVPAPAGYTELLRLTQPAEFHASQANPAEHSRSDRL